MRLSEAQSEAVRHFNGPCMVLAGPGSGKTAVITRRMRHLITERGVSPDKMLVITFSRAAASEMKRRFLNLMSERSLPVTIGTFHGVYYSVLKWAYRLKGDCFLDENEKKRMLYHIARREEVKEADAPDEDAAEFISDLAADISALKNTLKDLKDYEPLSCDRETFIRIYERYENRRADLKKLDFDDMLTQTLKLFSRRSDVLNLWREKFKYILIDEFQDINKAQYEVIKLLAEPLRNLFVVGDDDQSIYSFRGSDPKIMLNFPNDYPETKRILLGVNYRCDRDITRAATSVISRNAGRFEKKIISAGEDAGEVKIIRAKDAVGENAAVARLIKELTKSKVSLSDVAVLQRTTAGALSFAKVCAEYNIPVRAKGKKTDIYGHFIAKDMVSYMKMALGDRSRGLFLRVMNRPERGIARKDIDDENIDFDALIKLYDVIDPAAADNIRILKEDLYNISLAAPYAAVWYIRKKMNYDGFLGEYLKSRGLKEDEFDGITERIGKDAEKFSSLPEWINFAENAGEVRDDKDTDGTGDAQNTYNAGDALNVMTMHACKGLEFDTVFIMGVNEKMIPYKKAVLDADIEEERRLFYVAMTRAKKRLYLTYAKERKGKKAKASRFLDEIS